MQDLTFSCRRRFRSYFSWFWSRVVIWQETNHLQCSMVIRNIGVLPHYYKVSQPKIQLTYHTLPNLTQLHSEDGGWLSSETLVSYHIITRCHSPKHNLHITLPRPTQLHLEYGGSMVLRDVGIVSHQYTESQHRKLESSSPWKIQVSQQGVTFCASKESLIGQYSPPTNVYF
jgi:hypothetical protein